jgi:hypothetical protein
MSPALERDQAARERFLNDTRKHEMTVLRDDGLYRHLRFQEPGSSFYWYDIVTWPGRLVICGDAGDWMFARIPDMFEFFMGRSGSTGINPRYWAQKLQAPKGWSGAQAYEFDTFTALVREWLEDEVEQVDDPDALRAAVQERILDDPDGGAYHDESEALRRLRDFQHNGRGIQDAWDWDLREYDWSFLWCCWAIVEGIQQYRATQAEEVADAA